MLSHDDTPMCQIWYAYVKLAQTQIHGENIILILRQKVKVIQRSCTFVTHHPMVIHSYAKYGMTMSKDK